MSITPTLLGKTEDGSTITKYTLTNRHGSRVNVMEWGAAILEVEVPDRKGKRENVNLVFDSLDRYLGPHPGFGSTMGRFCNRIANARFPIDGTIHQVTINHGKHCLHGGKVNFSHLKWEGQLIHDVDPNASNSAPNASDPVGVRFTLVSPDGDEGFPGELTVTAEYRFNDDHELTFEYTATTTAATVINLTNHSYWNLGGVGSGTVLDHVAVVHADQVLSVDAELIPTGEFQDVANTPFDFRTPETFAKRIAALSASKGYDHCYVIDGEPGTRRLGTLRQAARVTDPDSGRVMEVETTQPGMQLYTGNHLKGNEQSNGHGSHDAFCLETQHFPDSPNQPHFPTTVLRPHEVYRERTLHRFGVE